MSAESRPSTGPALTLFILGTMIGLLSLLGRLGQDFHARLLTTLSGAWPVSDSTTAPAHPLPPLLRDLHRPGALLILAGFAVSTLCLVMSAALWHSAGQPSSRRTRAWTRFARSITGSLWIAMCSATLIANAGLRNALILAPGLVALVLFVAFVYLLVEVQFLSSAPPDDDPRRSRQ